MANQYEDNAALRSRSSELFYSSINITPENYLVIFLLFLRYPVESHNMTYFWLIVQCSMWGHKGFFKYYVRTKRVGMGSVTRERSSADNVL